ncbi:hypothetical protein KS4_28450 [Poriferisphaera corsica]|uniref:Uncharacterized protein n=2 Tax=Poriferisphaera corsica TaxID=2528020 RepID=A0A517YX25_9BACT|nr:hypothetical protein KS4_28450 [Poriferisphaera corsica]
MLGLMLVVLGGMGVASGCAGFAFVADFIQGGKVKAAYVLPTDKTLVMVDDPMGAVPNSQILRTITTNIEHYMQREMIDPVIEKNKKIEDPEKLESYVTLIPSDKIYGLEDEVGEDFAKMPINRIGKRLDADQVVYVSIKSFTIHYAGNVYRPNATVEVKVIDSKTGKRLFPEAKKIVDRTMTPPGYMLKVELPYQGVNFDGPSIELQLRRELAEQIGKQVAEVFYDHRQPQPGDSLPG